MQRRQCEVFGQKWQGVAKGVGWSDRHSEKSKLQGTKSAKGRSGCHPRSPVPGRDERRPGREERRLREQGSAVRSFLAMLIRAIREVRRPEAAWRRGLELGRGAQVRRTGCLAGHIRKTGRLAGQSPLTFCRVAPAERLASTSGLMHGTLDHHRRAVNGDQQGNHGS